MPRRVHLVVALACGVLSIASCTDESTTPINLSSTTTTVVDGEIDPNAEAKLQLEVLAKEECRKDPSREFGVIIISDPESGEEVNRFEYPCDLLDE